MPWFSFSCFVKVRAHLKPGIIFCSKMLLNFILESADREMFTELLFKVMVINGLLAKSHTVPARIEINDMNDNTPVLSPLFYNTEIMLSTTSGSRSTDLERHSEFQPF